MQTNKMIKAALMTALTAVGAYLIIPLPFSPVPITLQTFFVILSGRLLGKKYGALSQITYLLLGAAGLPIFSGGRGGLGVLAGPTGGFLISFITAAWIAGHYYNQEKKNFFIYAAAVLSNYIIGSTYFILITGTEIPAALSMTVIPFIPGDIFKIILVMILAPILEKRLRNY
ncbi:biotin transporter BioY [Halanaerobium sp. Z-7514]|uniref:Biotin transporter n=1 Tax=Halanaerobium polyolivorans TaxID=2886943 RepID=A0AAW4WYW1_9FIRM|nr:biotin transporter BioY [Halanaerobium polyolivorans]MCC3144409.1 biotin transporter BioY [Halanaerobium polyolivorans]RQD70465.1 MAG: biotin transporter BioY [Halanaerobium sp. MSAO_Bac5]